MGFKPFGMGVWKRRTPLFKKDWKFDSRRGKSTAYVHKKNPNLYIVKTGEGWKVVDLGIGAGSILTVLLSKHKVVDSGRKLKWVI